MKKNEIPQDKSALENVSKELCYALDENGNYSTDLSKGWEVKSKALEVAWSAIDERVFDAKQKVLNRECSPLLYFMELKLMDVEIVSAYTGFWKWQIKRHFKPNVFEKLSSKKIGKYSKLFEVDPEEFKDPFSGKPKP
ncbi:MAG: hypothetical protein H6605_04820 [Flavobacteriales bacterium]|nr:hypothetical protein [Flavobacteriales bacterium]